MDKINIKIFQENLNKLVLSKNKKTESIILWIKTILESIESKDKALMPSKADMAKLLNVGLGTVQNAYRFLEDEGLLISKQCVGTYFIPNGQNNEIRKLTSKKDKLINDFKSYLLNSNLSMGDKLKPVRFYSQKMKASTATIIQIFNQLEALGILENQNGIRIVKTLDFTVNHNNQETLADKICVDLKNYISENFKTGDKIPNIYKLSKMLNVSTKTIHSAIKKLETDGILKTRFGRYGTVVLRIPNSKIFYQTPETSIFASSAETYVYHYEKILNIISKMIYDNFEVGSKLPSIAELAMRLDVNPNTIRKCYSVLNDNGIVSFVRGRYGGTFVTEIPDFETVQTYQWLAVNNDF